jgi:PAS domain S-box-containing protein
MPPCTHGPGDSGSNGSRDELADQISQLRQGDHLCLIYEDAAEQMAAAVPFIADGLARNERCHHIVDDRTRDEVVRAMTDRGIDVGRAVARGSLVLSGKRDTYLSSGRFDPQGMIGFVGDAVRDAVSAGYSGLRVTGEMTWALGDEAGCDRIIEYEALLNGFFPGSRASAICQYNQARFPAEVVRDVLRTHPVAVLGDQVCPNIYYEPPDMVLGRTDERERVRWMVGRLREARSAERALQETGERFAAMVRQTAVGVAMADPEGRFVLANSRYCGMVGRGEGELLGLRMQDITHPDDLPGNAALFEKAVADGSSFEIEKRYVRPDGSAVWVRNCVSPIRDARSRTQYVLAVSADISERKRAEDERERLIGRLREADRRKDRFLATLAHELRNPLAPVRAALHILEAAGDDPLAAESAAEARAVLGRQIGHMVRLIDDLLDVARITTGRIVLQRRRVGLDEAVRAAVETARPLLDRMGHRLTVSLPEPPEPPVMLDADPTRLSQVLANLLNNAAKYTDAGGDIRLSAAREAGEAVIRVSDNGIGIPPDRLGRVFEMFHQVEGTVERSQKGLGIGLAVVKGLAELHGGRVEALSAGPGRGSEFVVRLPLPAAAPAVGPGGTGKAEPASGGPRLRVLVVDDSEDITAMQGTMLRILGHEVRTAGDGEQALAAGDSFRPDVVLMDLGMPRMDGYRAAREMRSRPWGRDATLVALSGWGQDEDRRRAAEAGFDRHLVKPVDFGELKRLLASCAARVRP